MLYNANRPPLPALVERPLRGVILLKESRVKVYSIVYYNLLMLHDQT